MARTLALVAGLGALVCLLDGCAGTLPPPDIKTLYTAATPAVARPDTAAIEVFLNADPPRREYDVLGQVEITTERESRTLENMLDYAKREARRLGGDALVNLETDATPTPATAGTTFPIYNLYTGKVIGYRSNSSGPGTRRVMKALVVKWR